MSGLIVPSTYNYARPIGRGEDVADITAAVQDGDATVGWRGDATMDVYREGSVVYVAGFDAKGEQYVAARAHMTDSDWRKTLLTKLRDGDWQSEISLVDVQKTEREKKEAAADKVRTDQIAEIADKFASAGFRGAGSKRFY